LNVISAAIYKAHPSPGKVACLAQVFSERHYPVDVWLFQDT
jgi:hypothetical protein